MTKHLKYFITGISAFAKFILLAIVMWLLAGILIIPSYLYIELGISWALWLYAIYLVVVTYVVGRLSSE